MGERERQRFELFEKLGGDVMERVFRAWDRALQREVALWFLLDWGERGGQRSDRLLRRLCAIARLDHENIVRIFDVGEWHGMPPVPLVHFLEMFPLEPEPSVAFLVTESIEGESLASLRQRERPGLRRTLELLGAVAAGLAHAHAHHMVHGDLNPNNVLITRGGGVKLLGLGLGHTLSDEPSPVLYLPRVGSPAYMAPEQWWGGAQDARIDLWAVGVMLYELLTGELPYPVATLQELPNRVLSPEPMPSVREHLPELPPEVEWLVADLLAKEPGRRLGSASELRERLLGLDQALGPTPGHV